jgi:hypothetical protein
MPQLSDLIDRPTPQAVGADATTRAVDDAPANPALDETAQPAERADRAALLAALARGTREARQTITAHSAAARGEVDVRARELRGKATLQTQAADDAVGALATRRRAKIDEAILARKKSIGDYEAACVKSADEYADNARKAQIEGFAFYRGLLEDAFNSWVRYTGTLKTFESDRLKRMIAEKAKDARHKGELYYTRFIRPVSNQSEGRIAVQREAAAEVAETYATEFEKAQPEGLAQIEKVCTSLSTELMKYRDQALLEYDKGLPIVLAGISEQLAATKRDIGSRTREALEMLANAAIAMRKRVDTLEETSRQRNAKSHKKLDTQIESAQRSAAHQFRAAVAAAMEPIAAIVDQAAGLLTDDAEELDPEAASQFVGEVVAFTQGAADATGTVFAEARDAALEKLDAALPFGRAALAAGKSDLWTTIRSEAAENAQALSTFAGSARTYVGSTLEALDETYGEAITQAKETLRPVVNDARQQLRDTMNPAKADLHKAVGQVGYDQNRAMEHLPAAMHNAARKAAWRYDHSILKHVVDALEVVLGFIIIVAVLVGIVAGLVVMFGALAVAIAGALIGGFVMGYFGAKAYDERRKAKQGPVKAFFGAIADVTGINEVRRAFTDPKMQPFERGMAWGAFWLNLVGLGEGASRWFQAIKLRLPPRFTNPFRFRRPPSAPVAELNVHAGAMVEPPRIGFELPHQKPVNLEIRTAPEAPLGTGKRQVGFVSSESPAPRFEAPEAPVGSPGRRVGFVSSEQPAPKLDVPEAPVTSGKRRPGFVSSEQPAPVLETPEAPVGSGKRRIGFVSSEQPAPVLEVPEAPVATGKRRAGFVSSEEPVRAPEVPEAVGAPRKRQIGFVSSEKPVPTSPSEAPRAPHAKVDATSNTPRAPLEEPPAGVLSDMPRAREVPRTPAGPEAAPRLGPRGEVMADAPEHTGPGGAPKEAPIPESTITGEVVSTVEPALPVEPKPAVTPPPPSSRATEAAKRVADAEDALRDAQVKRVADEKRVNDLGDEVKATEQLRDSLGRKGKTRTDDALKKLRRDLATAKSDLKKSRATERSAQAKATDAADAQQQVHALEQQIAELQREPFDMEAIGVPTETPQMVGKDLGAARLKPKQKAIYILREVGGKILKVGKTSFKGIRQRARKYMNAARENNMEVEWEVYPLEKPPRGTKAKSAEFYEKKLRDAMEGLNEEMPWDNTGGRLGRTGFGTPGEGVRRSKISKEEMEALLTRHHGNVAKAGEEIGKNGQTVRLWAKSLGLHPKDFKK